MVLFYFMGCFCTILGLIQTNSITLMKVVNDYFMITIISFERDHVESKYIIRNEF